MTFTCKKTENCFSDAQTYEYALPITVEELSVMFPPDWQQRCNRKLRRPVLLAECGQIRLKGILAGKTVRVSYADTSWEQEKAVFEHWLEEL